MAAQTGRKKKRTAPEGEGADTPRKKAVPKKRAAAKKKVAPKRATTAKKVADADSPPAPKKKSPARKKAGARKKKAATGDSPIVVPPFKPRRRRFRFKRPVLRASPAVRRWTLRFAVAGIALGVLLLTLSVGWVALYRTVDPPGSFLMIQRYYGTASDARKLSWAWRDLEDISPNLAVAVLAAEDQRFPDHNGFDTRELQNAIDAWQAGAKLRGASTLSQQTAKNAFLWPMRSFFRKGLEVWFTMLVEAMWPKRRILEIYLNIAEMGDGIYGAEAAAQFYFGKSARELTPDESARLASILPNPRERSPLNPSANVAQRQTWIKQQVRNLGGSKFLDGMN